MIPVGGNQPLLLVVAAIFGVALLWLLISSSRSRRDSGFAPKSVLRRQLSAKAVLQATDIRPSLTAVSRDSSASTVNLAKSTRTS
ncbi:MULTISPECIES: hypothetical protein [Streptacidiphilus]|uniref:Uncharacterized protein n=1 Tax=Streptacidiphilus cavernicola TaxID=3342716 RepID=A0ABV6UP17_9ACTN|nr:hypothetical protein [Streptacidiphilus jeojiense]